MKERIDDQMLVVQDLNRRLDDLEEFYLPDVIEHLGEPVATVTPARKDLQSNVRESRRIELIESNETILLKMLLDGMIVTMFVFSCFLLYNSIVWTIWG
jgi:hypothetical protein